MREMHEKYPLSHFRMGHWFAQSLRCSHLSNVYMLEVEGHRGEVHAYKVQGICIQINYKRSVIP